MNNRLANTIYDNMGNQTQLSVSAGTVASYDGENRMSKIAVGGAEIATYTYDAEGRRVAKTANGTTTRHAHLKLTPFRSSRIDPLVLRQRRRGCAVWIHLSCPSIGCGLIWHFS